MKLNFWLLSRLLFAVTLSYFAAQPSLAASYSYFGRDDSTFPSATPNASGTFAAFKSLLTSSGTDNLETAAGFDPPLTFGATGITATTAGVLAQEAPGFTSSGTTALLETDAAIATPALNTVFTLSSPVTAFGLFVIQGGDGPNNNNPITFQIENTLTASSKSVVLPVGPGWATLNTFFFGFADTAPFNKVTLIETGDLNDGMLYDDVTVGTFVPEPSSLVLLCTAAVLFPLALRRRGIARLVRR